MAAGYVVAVLSIVLEIVLDASNFMNTDQFKTELSSALSDHPVLVARLSLLLSVLFIAARLRSILGWGRKGDDP